MIPVVRVRYIQGLASVHDDLHRPREVDLTTDGESLIVAPAGSSRPLVKLPLAAVEPVTIESDGGPTTATSKAAAGLTGTEQVLVMRCRAAPGVPAAVAGQPIVLVPPRHGDVAATAQAIKHVLEPRAPEEIARLAEGGRRRALAVGVGFIGLVALTLVLVVLALMTIFAPRPRNAVPPGQQAPAAYALPVDGTDLAAAAGASGSIGIE
jgi:hypothetical protein